MTLEEIIAKQQVLRTELIEFIKAKASHDSQARALTKRIDAHWEEIGSLIDQSRTPNGDPLQGLPMSELEPACIEGRDAHEWEPDSWLEKGQPVKADRCPHCKVVRVQRPDESVFPGPTTEEAPKAEEAAAPAAEEVEAETVQ